MVIINFIRDAEVGIFARAKRKGKGLSTLAISNSSITCPQEPSDGSESDSGTSSGKKTD
jgi:hypothetical protein